MRHGAPERDSGGKGYIDPVYLGYHVLGTVCPVKKVTDNFENWFKYLLTDIKRNRE